MLNICGRDKYNYISEYIYSTSNSNYEHVLSVHTYIVNSVENHRILVRTFEVTYSNSNELDLL